MVRITCCRLHGHQNGAFVCQVNSCCHDCDRKSLILELNTHACFVVTKNLSQTTRNQQTSARAHLTICKIDGCRNKTALSTFSDESKPRPEIPPSQLCASCKNSPPIRTKHQSDSRVATLQLCGSAETLLIISQLFVH